jgi:hypothetical protein
LQKQNAKLSAFGIKSGGLENSQRQRRGLIRRTGGRRGWSRRARPRPNTRNLAVLRNNLNQETRFAILNGAGQPRSPRERSAASPFGAARQDKTAKNN